MTDSRSSLKCPKAPHDNPSGGYLHGEDDDRPYDVDGMLYCGRCHFGCDKEGRCEHLANRRSSLEENVPTLLPCPFCGGTPMVEQDFHARNQPWVVYCPTVNACAVEPEVADISRTSAISAWNRRPPVGADSEGAGKTLSEEDAKFVAGTRRCLATGAYTERGAAISVRTVEGLVAVIDRLSSDSAGSEETR